MGQSPKVEAREQRNQPRHEERKSKVHDIEAPQETSIPLSIQFEDISWHDSPWNFISNRKQFLAMTCKRGIKPMNANVAFRVIQGLKSSQALPPNWEARVDSASGVTYYYNTTTQKSEWERPNPESSCVQDKIKIMKKAL